MALTSLLEGEKDEANGAVDGEGGKEKVPVAPVLCCMVCGVGAKKH
jgi:hypothetical protein